MVRRGRNRMDDFAIGDVGGVEPTSPEVIQQIQGPLLQLVASLAKSLLSVYRGNIGIVEKKMYSTIV